MLSFGGKNANYVTPVGTSPRFNNQSLATNLASAGYMLGRVGFSQAQTPYWWVGSAFAVSALDPLKFYADVMYGEGAANDGKNRRGGLFFDVGAEYTGLDVLTPQVAFWYSTGEDSSTRNGS